MNYGEMRMKTSVKIDIVTLNQDFRESDIRQFIPHKFRHSIIWKKVFLVYILQFLVHKEALLHRNLIQGTCYIFQEYGFWRYLKGLRRVLAWSWSYR